MEKKKKKIGMRGPRHGSRYAASKLIHDRPRGGRSKILKICAGFAPSGPLTFMAMILRLPPTR
jgi:hypothetical protein